MSVQRWAVRQVPGRLDGLQLDGLERHGELVDGRDRYNPVVRTELLSMSAATIDRYLKTARATDVIKGVSITKPSLLLRNSTTVRKAGDEIQAEPGFFEGDRVAYCGPTLKGEFVRTLNLTDAHTEWVFTRTIRNHAHTHVLAASRKADSEIPYAVTGLDFDNGTEFLNQPLLCPMVLLVVPVVPAVGAGSSGATAVAAAWAGRAAPVVTPCQVQVSPAVPAVPAVQAVPEVPPASWVARVLRAHRVLTVLTARPGSYSLGAAMT